MKKEYRKPSLSIEMFLANTYVSICYIPQRYTLYVSCDGNKNGWWNAVGNWLKGHEKCENNRVEITVNVNGISNITVTEIQTSKTDSNARLDGNTLTWNIKNNNQKFDHSGTLDFNPETTNRS